MNAIELVQGAMKKAEKIRPKVGGFPYLAECMREAGVLKNVWTLPVGQSTFWTSAGVISVTNSPMVSGFHEVPVFDQEALIKALRADQAGQTTFPEFLSATWEAGVISYEADFSERKVTYLGSQGESYVEAYPAVIED